EGCGIGHFPDYPFPVHGLGIFDAELSRPLPVASLLVREVFLFQIISITSNFVLRLLHFPGRSISA
ncbi:MAG TPA: hypothetical protein PLF58_05980, partial [Smithella sp.]|nr:hypothetical protein [Smithella sp.]